MPAWPTAVPFFRMNAGTQLSIEGDVLRSEMDVGPPKQRLRSSYLKQNREGTTPPLTPAQLAALRTFFEQTLSNGVLSFTATDPFDGAAVTCRIVGGLRVSKRGLLFIVKADLERL